MRTHEAYTCIVRFNNTPIGSGFLVHDSGLIATCHHVLIAAGNPVEDREYQINSLRKPTVVPARVLAYDKELDVALLQVVGNLDLDLTVAPLISSEAVHSQMGFVITAFGVMPDKDRRFEFVSAQGTITGSMRHEGVDLLQISSQEILKGMSGSPLTVPELGGVVGVLSGRYNVDLTKHQWMRDVAWAAKIEALEALDQRIKAGSPQPPMNASRQTSTVAIGTVERMVQVTEAGLVNANNIQLTLSDDHWRQPNDQDPQRRWEGVIGRDEDLDAIAARLPADERGGQTVAVYGLAGIGKSTLAAAFVDRYGDNFRGPNRGGVLWASISIDEPIQILNRWGGLAYSNEAWRMLQLGERPQFDASALKRILGGHGPLLVVFDDVHSVDEIRPLMDALPPEARILITTRELTVAEHFDHNPLRLRELPNNHAVALLQRDVSNLEPEELEVIAGAFGCHPQALRMIGSRLKGRQGRERKRSDIQALLQRIESGGGVVADSAQTVDSLRSITLALRFIYDDISDDETLRTEYQRRMRGLGALAPSEADFSLELAASIWQVTEDEAADFLELLRDRALLAPTSERRWSQHALVRAVMRELLSEVDEAERNVVLPRYVTYTSAIVSQFDQLLTKWDSLAPDLPHVYYVGDVLCGMLEEATGYEPGGLIFDDLIRFEPHPMPDLSGLFETIRQYIVSSLPFLMNYPQPSLLTERWLTAGIVIARILDDTDCEAQVWYYWHNYLFRQNRVSETISTLEHMRAMADRTSTPHAVTILALTELGQTYGLQGEIDRALLSLGEAYDLSTHQEDLDPVLRVNLLTAFGHLSMMASQEEQALNYIKEAYDLLDPNEINYMRLKVTQMLSLCYVGLGKPEEALEFFSDATQYLDVPGTLVVKANLLNNKGYILANLGEIDEAMECYHQALDLTIKTNDPATRVSALNNIAQIELGQDNYEAARAHLEEARNALNFVTDKNLEAQTIGNLGLAYYALGQADTALELLKQSLLMLRQIKERTSAVRILAVIGRIYQSTGRLVEGIEFFKQMLEVINTLRDEGVEITILNWISLLYKEDSDPQRALKYFERALPNLERISDPSQRGLALGLVANIYLNQGKPSEALRSFKEAVLIWQRLGHRANQYDAQIGIVFCYILLREINNAQETFQECEQGIEQSDNQPLKAAGLRIRAMLAIERQAYTDAVASFRQSADLYMKLGDHQTVILIKNQLATVFLSQSKMRDALAMLRDALEMSRNIEQPSTQALILSNLGIIYLLDAQQAKGIESFQAALDLMEQYGLSVDVAGQPVDLLRWYFALFRQIQHRDGNVELPVATVIPLLSQSTNWNMVEALLNLEAMSDPGVEGFFRRAISHASNDSTLVNVLRMYQQILYWYRECNNPAETVRRAQDMYEKPYVYHWWGRVALASKAYDMALASCNRAIEIDDQPHEYYATRGWAYRGLGNYQAARRDFDQVVLREPESFEGYLGRGVVQFEVDETGGALADLNQAIKIDPRSAQARQWRSTLLLHLGDTKAALDDIDDAIRINPAFPDHYYWRSLIYLRAQNSTKALDDLEFLVQTDIPETFDASLTLLWRGLVCQFKGDDNYAQAYWQQAEAVASRLLNGVQRNLALALHAIMKNRLEDAYRFYQESLNLRFTRHMLITQTRHIYYLHYILSPQQKQKLLDLHQWLQQQLEKE